MMPLRPGSGSWRWPSAWRSQPVQVGRYGFPDQLGDVDDEIGFGLAGAAGRADLADTDADDVVQPPVGLTVGQVEQRPHDLTASRWIGAAVPTAMPWPSASSPRSESRSGARGAMSRQPPAGAGWGVSAVSRSGTRSRR